MTGPNATEWCEKALTSVLSLWDHSRNQAWRGSQEHSARQAAGAKGQLRPTATFNAVLAFGECGFFLKDTTFRSGTIAVPPLHLKVKATQPAPEASKLLRAFLADPNWADYALASSEHGTQATGDGTLTPRASMMLGRLVPAILQLTQSVPFSVLFELGDVLLGGLARIQQCLTKVLFSDPLLLFDDPSFSKPATVSPQIVLHAALAATGWQTLKDYLLQREANLAAQELADYTTYVSGSKPLHQRIDSAIGDSASREIHSLLAVFTAYFSRQVDRQMARKQVLLDPDHDIAALAYSLHGWSLVNADVRTTPFFKSCVAAVVEGQNTDGCWPEGMTVASHERSDVGPVRQPSVEIALSLAETVFR